MSRSALRGRILRSTTFLTGAIACLAGPAYAQAGSTKVWQPRSDLHAQTGTKDNNEVAVELFVPMAQNDETLLFSAARIGHNEQFEENASLTLGLRKIVGTDLALGINIGADIYNSEYSSRRRSAASIGLEAFTSAFDLHLNFHAPLSSERTFASVDPAANGAGALLIENNRLIERRTGFRLDEIPLKGVNGEIGYTLPVSDKADIRLSGGGFRYQDEQAERHVGGQRGGLELTMRDIGWEGARFSIGADVQDDNRYGTQVRANARLSIPLGSSRSRTSQSRLQRQMGERVRRDFVAPSGTRNTDLVLNSFAIDARTGNEFGGIYYVNGTAAAGAGTLTNPTTLGDAVTRSGQNGVSVVLGGAGDATTAGVTLIRDQYIVGGASNVDVRLTTGATTQFGFGGTNGIVRGTAAAGSAITLGQGSVVRDVTVRGAGIGISGSGVGGFRLDRVTIEDTGSVGLSLANTTGTVVLDGLTVRRAGGTGVSILGGSAVTLRNSTISGAAGAIRANDGGAALALSLSNLTLSSTGGTVLNLSGAGAGTLTVNALSGLTIAGGQGEAGGFSATSVAFDSDPLLAGLQALDAGRMVVGTAVSRVTGPGVALTDVAGSLTFADLDIANSGGTGLRVVNSKVNDFLLTTLDGTIDTVGGTAIDLDPLRINLIFASVGSSGATGAGVVFDTVVGAGAGGRAANIATLTVSNSGQQGLFITGGSTGLFTIGGGLIGGSGGSAIQIGETGVAGSGGTVGLIFGGTVVHGSNTALLSISEHSGAAVAVTGNLGAASGSGLQFDNADGSYSFTGTNALNGGDAGIDILNGSGGAFTFGAGTTIVNSGAGAFRLLGSSASVTFGGTISQSGAGPAVSLGGTSGAISLTGAISSAGTRLLDLGSTGTVGGTISITGALTGSGGIVIGNTLAGSSVTVAGPSLSGVAGNAISLNAIAGSLTFTGTTLVNNPGSAGIAIGSVPGGVRFNDVDITGLGANTTGLDLRGTQGNVIFRTLDIAGASASGTRGIDLTGSANAGSVITQDSGSITGVGIGVDLTNASISGAFQYGDGSNTDADGAASTIGATVPLVIAGLNPAQGSYNFADVNLVGDVSALQESGVTIYYVLEGANGDGSRANPGSLAGGDNSSAQYVVLLNNPTGGQDVLDAATAGGAFDINPGQRLVSFLNTDFIATAGALPANLIVQGIGPFGIDNVYDGSGAPVLTTTALNTTTVAMGGNSLIDGLIIDNQGTGFGVSIVGVSNAAVANSIVSGASGAIEVYDNGAATSATLTNLSLSAAAGTVLSLNGTGAGTATVSGSAIDIAATGTATGLDMDTVSAPSLSFGSIGVGTSFGPAVRLESVSGMVAADDLAIAGTSAGAGLLVSNSSADVEIGSLTVANAASHAVHLTGDSGEVVLGNVDIAASAGAGILVENTSGFVGVFGGTITQSGAFDAVGVAGLSGFSVFAPAIINTGSGNAVSIDDSDGVALFFGPVSSSGSGGLLSIGAAAGVDGYIYFDTLLTAASGNGITIENVGINGVVYLGDVALSGVTGSAISLANIDGFVDFYGTTTIDNPGNSGIRIGGGSTGDIAFGDVDITGLGANTTGLDARAASGWVSFQTLDIMGSSAAGTRGIDLTGATFAGSIVTQESGTISGVGIGVDLTNAAITGSFQYGDGSNTDADGAASTISATTPIVIAGMNGANGSYNFRDVNLAGDTTSLSTNATIYWVQEGKTGAGTRSDPGSLAGAEGSSAQYIVLLNDDSDSVEDTLDAVSAGGSFDLDTGQTLLSFLNQDSFVLPGGAPANLFLFGIEQGLSNPYAGSGAPTLTTTAGAGAATLVLGGGNAIDGVIVANGGSGAGILASGVSGNIAINGSQISTGSGTALSIIAGGALNLTGAGSTITTASGTLIDIANGTAGAVTINAAFDSASNISGATGISIADTGAGSITGTLAIGGGSINATLRGVDLYGDGLDFTYGGGITVTGLGARSVEATNRTGGTATFSGNIDDSGSGINIADNLGGALVFSGASKILDTGTSDALRINSNAAGTSVSFLNGGLDITTTSGEGIFMFGDGDLAISCSCNSITTGSGTGVILNTGNGTIDIDAAIITTGIGRSVTVANRSGGVATFSGNIDNTSDGLGGANTFGGGILILNNSGNAQAIFSGASKQLTTSGGTAAVTVSGSGSSDVSFTNGGLVINTDAGNGITHTGAASLTVSGTGNLIATNSGIGVRLSTGAGNVDVNADLLTIGAGTLALVQNRTGGTATLSGNLGSLNFLGDGLGVLIQNNNGGAIVFSGASKDIDTGANAAIRLVDNSAATAIGFIGGGLDIDTTSGTGLSIVGGGLLTVSGLGNSITTNSGTIIDISNSGAAALVLDAVFAAGANSLGATGIAIANTGSASITGTLAVGSGSIDATLRGVDLYGDGLDFTYGGSITVGGGGARSVEATNRTGGTATFSGNIADTGLGINIADNLGGALVFSGASKILNTGTNDALRLNSNAAGTSVSFTGGGLDIDTTSGVGIFMFGNGNLSISGANNSVTTGSGGGVTLNTGNGTIGVNADITTTGIGRTVTVANRTGGTVADPSIATFSGNIDNTAFGNTFGAGILLLNNSGGAEAVFSGASKTITTSGGTAAVTISGSGNSIVSFTGDLDLVVEAGDAIRISGPATASFGDVDIAIGANGTGLDVSAAKGNVTLNTLDITGTSAPGSRGIDLRNATFASNVITLDSGTITGVDIGVDLTNAAITGTFQYGDGSNTDADGAASTINATTPIVITGMSATGTYNFADVNLIGDTSALTASATIFFVEQGASGTGTAADPGSLTGAEASGAEYIILLNNPSGGQDTLDASGAGGSLELAAGQNLIAFLNGDTQSVSGGAPNNLILYGIVAGSVSNPYAGSGAPVLTTTTGGGADTIVLAGGNLIDGVIVANGGSGAGIFASGAGGATTIRNSQVSGRASAIDISDGAATVALSLQNLVLSASGGSVVSLSGTGAGSLTVTGLGGITIQGGNGEVGGFTVNGVTFDSNTAAAGLQAVNAGAVAIGTSANRLSGRGLSLDNVFGTVNFADLDIFNTGNSGLNIVNSKANAFTLTTADGTIDTVGANAIFIDPLAIDLVLSSVTSAGSFGSGIYVSDVTGAGPGARAMQVGVLTVSNAGQKGVQITGGSSGSFSFGAGSAITNSGQAGIQIGEVGVAGSGGTVNLDYRGNISQANAAELVGVYEHGSGTIAFGTGTLSATNGTALQFDNADGTYNFNGTTTINGTSAAIWIFNGSAGTFAFGAGTSITNANAALWIDNSAANVIYSGNISQTGGAALLQVTNHTGSLTFQTGTINLAGNTGLLFSNASGSYAFNGTASLTGISKVSLNTSSGSFTFGPNFSIANTTGTAFLVQGGSANVTYSGNLSKTGTGLLLSVTSGHSGAITFQTGTLSATNGTGIQFGDADGTYAFNGTTTLNGGNAGIDILASSSGSLTFGSGTSIVSPTGIAFNLTSNDSSVTYAGSITQANNAAAASVAFHSGGTLDFTGATFNVSNGPGLVFVDADGSYQFGSSTLAGADAGIDILTGSAGTFSFGDIDINGLGAGQTAVDLTGATGNVTFATLDISGASGSGTRGINLTGSTTANAIIINESSTITGVGIGVDLTNAAITGSFRYGDGSNTDADGAASTINATTPLVITGMSATGTYDFADVNLIGDTSALSISAYYVEAGAGGTGSSVNPGSLAGAEASGASYIVLLNNPAGGQDTLDAAGAGGFFGLAAGQILLGFLNQDSFAVPGGPPANLLLYGIASGSIVNPYAASGAPVLTNLAGGGAPTLVLGGGNIIDGVTIANDSSGAGVSGSGAAGLTIIRNSLISGSGGAISVADGAATVTLSLQNLVLSASGGPILNLLGTGAGALTLTQLSGISIVPTGIETGGFIVNDVTFDADTATAGIQAVNGGALTLGTPGSRVGGSGLSLTNVSGALSFADLDIANNGGTGLLVANSKANGFVLTTLDGSTDTTGGTAVSLDPLTLAVTLASVTASGGVNAILLDNAEGSFTVTGAVTATGTSGAGIEIRNNTGQATPLAATFAGAVGVNNGAGAGVALSNNGGATIAFNGDLDIATTTGTGLSVSGGGTLTILGAGNTIATGSGTVIGIANAGASALTLNAAFATGSNASGANGILVARTGAGAVTGTLNVAGGAITGTTRGVDLDGDSLAFTYGGTIATSGVNARSVEATSRSAGTATFSGNITDTSLGINIGGNTGGALVFSGASKSLGTDGNTALALSGNGALSAVSFINGGLAIATTSGDGIAVSGGGDFTASGAGNTIATGAGGTNGTGVTLNGGNGAILIQAAITTEGGGRPASIINRTGGTATFTGNLDNTVGGNTFGGSLLFQNNSGGAQAIFSGASKVLTTTGGTAAVTVSGAGAASLSFTNGGLVVGTAAGNGISHTGAAAVTVSGAGNSITTATGIGVRAVTGAGNIDVNAALTTTGAGTLALVQTRSGGTVDLSGNLASNVSGVGLGILVQNNTGGTASFSGTSKALNTGANAAVRLLTNTATTVNFTGGGLAIGTTAGTGFLVTGSGTVNVSGAGNTITTGSGTVIDVTNATANALTLNAAFASGSNGSGATGINVAKTGAGALTGTLAIGGGAITATTRGVDLDGDSLAFTYDGAIATAGAAARSVEITNRTGGSAALSGNITDTSLGMNIANNSGGSASFSGAKALNTGANNALTLSGNAAGTSTSFTNGGLAITTTTGTGFLVTGSGTVDVSGAGNTVTTGSGTVIDVTNATASGLTLNAAFASGSNASGATGINVAKTGAGAVTGTLAVNGGAITATARGVDLDGDGLAFSYAGSIATSGAAARSVEATGRTGGTATFSGAVTDTSLGVNIDTNPGGALVFTGAGNFSTGANSALTLNNNGAPVTFSGGLILNTGAAAALLMTGNGALTISGSGNTIATTSGTAVSINGGNGAVTINSAVSTATGALAVIQNRAVGSTTTVSGNLNTTGLATGITVQNNLGGTIAFSGGTKTINTGANTAITLSGNAAGVATSFTNGGLAIATTSGTGVSAAGAGNLTISGSANTIGTATGTGVSLTNATGTIDLNAAIATTGAGLLASVQSQTAGTATLSGNLSTTATGLGILVQNNSGGTTTFSGATKTINTGANNAVRLLSNNGATVNFTGGGLDIDTTTGTGFLATGGGTFTVQGTGNSITSVSQTALNVANTNIGALGLTFQSISSGNNTAAADPVSGIILNATGASGGLFVAGDGGGSNNGSGGTIQFTSGAGIDASSGSNLSLGYMNIQNGGDDGIRATSITNLTLNRLNVSSNGNAVTEYGLDGLNVIGTVAVTNAAFSGSFADNLRIQNSAGSTAFTVSGSSFSSSTQGGGLFHVTTGTASSSVQVSTTNFTNNYTTGLLAGVSDPGATGTVSFTVTGGNYTGNNAGIQAIGSGSADVTFSITGANIGNNPAAGIAVDLSDQSTSTGSMIGTIASNTINMPASGAGNGIFVSARGGGVTTLLIDSNNVTNRTQYGIHVHRKEGGATGALNATITNNTVTTVDVAGDLFFPIDSIRVEAGAAAADAGTLCADIRGNIATGANSVPLESPGSDIRLRHRFGVSFQLAGAPIGSLTSPQVESFVDGNNTSSGLVSATTTSNFTGVASCPVP